MQYTAKQLKIKQLASWNAAYARALVGCALDAIRVRAPYRVDEAREAWCALDASSEAMGATSLADVLLINDVAFERLPRSYGPDTWWQT